MVRYIALFLTLILTACQAPVPAAPTSAPTSAPPAAKPTTAAVAAAASPSLVAAPSPSPAAVVASPSPAAAPPPAGSSRVDVLNAANAAFARGDLTNASGLYERVLNTPPAGEPPDQTSAVNSFARFRAMVTLLADGREDDAKAQLDAQQKADANAPMTRLAAQIWEQYSMVGSLRGACAQAQPQVASQAGPTLAALQALGVSVDPQTLCSPPTGGAG